MNDDVIAYQLGELAEMQAVRKRGPMIDRDRLREALAYEDGELIDLPVEDTMALIVEAARLVASEDTLTVWWCEEHKSIRESKSRCLRWYDLQELKYAPGDCRMAEAVLAFLEGK